jgi:hypothetical protein
MNKDWFLVGSTLLSSLVLAAGCSFINAPSEVKPGEAGGAGGASSSSSSSSTSTSSSSSGMGGAGGGAMLCEPGSQAPCYEGAPGTQDVGACRAGVMTCAADGQSYGPCEGQVMPAAMDECTTPLIDEDCDGVENNGCMPEQLAIVAAAPPGYADEVRSQLMATMKFGAITIYDASVATPALVDLQLHQSVLVFSDKVFLDPVALGDVLAQYYDGGGRVVLAAYSTTGMGTRIQGAFGDMNGKYMITNPGGALTTPTDDALGTLLEPQSLLLRDVMAFDYTASVKSQAGVINGGVVVAQWKNGLPLIVRGTVNGRNRVDLNFYPPQTQMGMKTWSGDGIALIRNAVLF